MEKNDFNQLEPVSFVKTCLNRFICGLNSLNVFVLLEPLPSLNQLEPVYSCLNQFTASLTTYCFVQFTSLNQLTPLYIWFKVV